MMGRGLWGATYVKSHQTYPFPRPCLSKGGGRKPSLSINLIQYELIHYSQR